MENGIYTRREFRIVVYEKEGAAPFVVIHNDHYADEPWVLSGDTAESLMLAIADYLNVADNAKGS